MRWKVERILEPDFGCEGRPDGYVQKDTVILRGEDGTRKKISASDHMLAEKSIEEGSEIGDETVALIQAG